MPSRGRKHKRQAFRGTAYALGMSPRMLRRLRYTMPVGTRSVFPTSTSAQILQRMQDTQESVRSHIQEAYCNPLLQAWGILVTLQVNRNSVISYEGAVGDVADMTKRLIDPKVLRRAVCAYLKSQASIQNLVAKNFESNYVSPYTTLITTLEKNP